VINEHFTLATVRSEQEGGKVTLPKGFDAASVRLTGKVTGEAPFTARWCTKAGRSRKSGCRN